MEKDRIVVSGINGFVGHHLARELHSIDGVDVIGIGREPQVNPAIADVVSEYHQADLTKAWPETSSPRAVIHLASIANVGASFKNPEICEQINTPMVDRLCEYYLSKDNKPRIIIVSTGTVYDPNQPMPIAETGKLGPTSPYAKSKLTNERQAEQYREKGLECIVVRPFNHIGPGQGSGFILPDFFNRLASLRDGENTIVTGNLETKRDYSDVRDIVRAYGMLAIAASLDHNTYNLSSGESFSGVELFEELKDAMDLPNVNYQIDPSLVRPTDIGNIVGDSSRIREELGWKPEISFRTTIQDFVKSQS